MNFQEIRKEYESEGILEEDLVEDPIEQFHSWFKLATEKCPGRWFESNAMSLATSDTDGNVSCRAVLLKDVSDKGFVFFTNYLSQKGQQLSANPKAALLFHWPYLGRQVRIEGEVEKTDRSVSEEYFHSRPRGSQIGAAISNQSEFVSSREELESRAAEFTDRLGDAQVPCPQDWGGYLVRPKVIEFWQGRLNRIHDRIVYRLTSDGLWSRVRLSP